MAGQPSGEAAALFRHARDWLAAGHGVAVATVIETWGSSPRPRGAQMLVRDDGAFEGSVSGGCVEGDVIVHALEVLRHGGFRRLDYGVSDARAWTVGLACGGRLAVLVQPVAPAFWPPALVAALLDAHDSRRRIGVSIDLTTGRTDIAPDDQTFPGAARAVPGGADSGVLRLDYPPPWRLAIVGAVHIAQALAPLAGQLGYMPLVIDPRPAFATAARFPDVALSSLWPDEALTAWRPDPYSAIVVLSHDPKLDDPALSTALDSQVFYIGALGSRRTHAARLERLAARGFAPAALARVHGPVGLAIGARSAMEIALSIAAQMTAVRHGLGA